MILLPFASSFRLVSIDPSTTPPYEPDQINHDKNRIASNENKEDESEQNTEELIKTIKQKSTEYNQNPLEFIRMESTKYTSDLNDTHPNTEDIENGIEESNVTIAVVDDTESIKFVNDQNTQEKEEVILDSSQFINQSIDKQTKLPNVDKLAEGLKSSVPEFEKLVNAGKSSYFHRVGVCIIILYFKYGQRINILLNTHWNMDSCDCHKLYVRN